MLNKPKFMKPSTNKEECTIDLTADKIPFSCIVDGNESINKWQIKIYDITNDKEVFTTGEITLEPSLFYPVDEKNRNVVFSRDLKGYISENNTTFVNRAEAYYWTITFWGTSGTTTTSYPEVFYANTTPTVSISYTYSTGGGGDLIKDAVLESRACTFKAKYEQANGVQLKRYGWKITDADSGQVLIDTITSNQIYGSADNIICKYDGFLNGGNYSVALLIETQNNAKITPPPLSFSVSYSSTFLSNDFSVETLKNEPAIMLDWNKALVIAGILKDSKNNVVSIDDTIFKTNYPVDKQCSIEVPDKFKVVYEKNTSLNFDIDENSYIGFSTQLLSDTTDELVMFFAEGSDENNCTVKRQLLYGYDDKGNRAFIYTVEGHDGVSKSDTHKIANRPSEYVWYNIFMSPLIETGDGVYTAELNVYEGVVENCIYPLIDLYPREDFYPTFGNWTNLKPASDNGTEV